MAIKSYRVDDLDGKTTEGVETVTFAFEGKAYEIDLSEKNRAEFTDLLSKYLEAAQPVTSRPQSVARTSSDAPRRVQTMKYSSETMAEATAWAKSEEGEKALEKAGVAYSGVGRTPYAVVEEYLKTQK